MQSPTMYIHHTGGVLTTLILATILQHITGILQLILAILSIAYVIHNLRKTIVKAGGINNWLKGWKDWGQNK